MKTPRRRHHNSRKYAADVYSRESGPLEIGELETPNERRSTPVAAVRYLAGSKCHTASGDESYSSELSDYMDARSEDTDSERDETGRYRAERAAERPRPHRASELRARPEHDYARHLPSNFAREFKLRYASNLASDVHYYHAARATQDTLFHNMDYIHSQVTSFNPNFINFNYGHFSYPNYQAASRQSDFYAAYPSRFPKFAGRPHEPPYARPEAYYPRGFEAYRPDACFYRPPDYWAPRSLRHSDSYYGPNSASTPNYSTIANYSVSDHSRTHGHRGHQPAPDHEPEPKKSERSPTREEAQLGRSHGQAARDSGHSDAGDKAFSPKDEDAMKQAIEKAVRNALDTYMAQNRPNRGEDTCITDPVRHEFTFEKNDMTLTNLQEQRMYPGEYLNALKLEGFGADKGMSEFTTNSNANASEQVTPLNEQDEPQKQAGAAGGSLKGETEAVALDMKKLNSELVKICNDLNLDDAYSKAFSQFASDPGNAARQAQEAAGLDHSAQVPSEADPLFSHKQQEAQFEEYLPADLFSRPTFTPEFPNKNLREETRFNSRETEPEKPARERPQGGLFADDDELTNRDDESEQVDGSNYEMECAESDYNHCPQDYFPKSTFNLNNFNSFNALRETQPVDTPLEGSENLGRTLSASDLADSENQAGSEDGFDQAAQRPEARAKPNPFLKTNPFTHENSNAREPRERLAGSRRPPRKKAGRLGETYAGEWRQAGDLGASQSRRRERRRANFNSQSQPDFERGDREFLSTA